MPIVGPQLDARPACEAVLRSVPQWFGIEDALVMYADDTLRLPTFAVQEQGQIVAFATLLQHFPQAWEIHCMAVRADRRNTGIGRGLVEHCKTWLRGQGVRLLQVKTVAATSPSKPYAETRRFYERMGFAPLEVFPLLWAPHNPALLMVMSL